MLLKMFCLRLLPVLCLVCLKDRRKMKRNAALLCFCYCMVFFLASIRIFHQERWKGILYLSLSLFPHGVFYLFSIWLIIQCLWKMWSKRVWKRICYLSIFSTVLGIFAEKYINPQILQFFFGNFK